MDINKLTENLKRLVAISLKADNSIEFVSEFVRRVEAGFFINMFWHSLLNIAQDAMMEYQVMKLDSAFFTKYVSKKKLPSNLMITFRDFAKMSTEKMSIHRFRLELDIYLENMAVLNFRETLVEVSKSIAQKAYKTSRSDLMLSLSEIDRAMDKGTLPEGDITDTIDDVLDEFKLAEKGELAVDTVHTGFPTIDEYTGGFSRGDLIFTVAYSGEGKSTVILNAAYHALMQGKNVIYFVNELQFSQLRLKFASRHTANHKFWNGQLNGVPSKGIMTGQLNPMQQKVLKASIHDFKTNKDYGKLYLVQLPSHASLSYIESKMTAIQATRNLDLCVIDDVRLCTGSVKGNNTTEVLSRVVIAVKGLAVNFNGGKGIPIISPWQTKQKAYEEALAKGEYLINSNSDTNEVEKQADIILWLLRTDEMKRKRQLLCGVAKNRMGGCPDKMPLMEAYEYSYVAELGGVSISNSGGSVAVVPSGDYSELLRETLGV